MLLCEIVFVCMHCYRFNDLNEGNAVGDGKGTEDVVDSQLSSHDLWDQETVVHCSLYIFLSAQKGSGLLKFLLQIPYICMIPENSEDCIKQ